MPIYLLSAHTADGRDFRCFGYFTTLAKARSAARRDSGGMSECRYTYLVIERMGEGVHATAHAIDWYHYDLDDELAGHWVKCEPPVWAKNTVNFAIG
jgi:hypothetical protein